MLQRSQKYGLFLATALILDQISKQVALKYSVVHYNTGIFLGVGSEYFANSLITFLSTFSVFFLALYVFFLKNFGKKYTKVKVYLSLLIGGILGNVVDRLIYGKTIDFIPGINSYFNIADVFIVGSILALLVLILHKKSNIFFENDARFQIIVNKKEQFRLAGYFGISSFLSCLTCGVFIFTFLKYNHSISQSVLNELLALFITLSVLLTFFFTVFGLLLSHKSIGALYAFERYIKELIAGKDREFRLRENDDFKHLIKSADALREKFKDE